MPRQPLQLRRQAANRIHRPASLVDKAPGSATGLIDPHHERVRALGMGEVLPGSLSELVARRGDIQYVVSDLIGQPEGVAEVRESLQKRLVRPRRQRTDTR